MHKQVGNFVKKTMFKENGRLNAGGILTGAGFAGDTIANLHGGDDFGTSVLKAGVTGVMFASNPVIAGSYVALDALAEGYWGVQKFNMQKRQWWNSQYAYDNKVGGNYMDTQRAQTMRQAAVQAIQGSKMNARSALGGEAQILNPYASRRY